MSSLTVFHIPVAAQGKGVPVAARGVRGAAQGRGFPVAAQESGVFLWGAGCSGGSIGVGFPGAAQGWAFFQDWAAPSPGIL